MQKVWNAQKRAYEYHAEGISVDGIDYDKDAAFKKWNERGGSKLAIPLTAKRIIQRMIDGRAIFAKHHNWLEEMEHQILLTNHAEVERYKGKGSGATATKEFVTIPAKYRAGILAIAQGNIGAYDRGAHNTCPARQVGGLNTIKEYHLVPADQSGRATSAKAGGRTYIYYATSHAHGTYNYYLVTHPISITVGGATIRKDVPLTAGTRDGLIKLPLA